MLLSSQYRNCSTLYR